MKIFLSSHGNSDIVICSGSESPDLEYMDDIVLLSKDSGRLQVFFNHLNNRTIMLGTRFVV